MNHGFLPPTINYAEADPECDLNYVPNRSIERETEIALCNCIGFGSKNSALVVGAGRDGVKRSAELEMMDLPGQPKELLAGNLRDLRIINRYLGSYRSVLSGLARLVREQKTATLHAARRRHRAAATSRRRSPIGRGGETSPRGSSGLERDAITVEQAMAQTQEPARNHHRSRRRHGAAVSQRRLSILFWRRNCCIILPTIKSSLCCAHWARLARRAIIVSDLLRHPLAYHGIRLLTRGFTRNAMTRVDAPLSVRRACTLAEWSELIRRADIGTFRVQRVLPFRVLGVISLKSRS